MSRHITVRLMAEQIDRLDMVAEARGLDRSNTIRRLIDEASMTAEERRQLPTEQELLELLAERARAGNVGAVKALLDRLRRERDAEEPEPSEFDELDGLVARHRDRRNGLVSGDLPDDPWGSP